MPRARRNSGGPRRVRRTEEVLPENREVPEYDGEGNQASTTSEPPVYFPIFCLTEPDFNYWKELASLAADNDVDWTVINTNSPSKNDVLASINNNNTRGITGPHPFLNGTSDDVEDYYLSVLRPAGNSRGLDPFTRFTWLIIDEECVNHSPNPQIAVVTYAPDFAPQFDPAYENGGYEDENDPEPALKTLYMDLHHAFLSLYLLETLTATPSEVITSWQKGRVLSSMPPCIAKHIPSLNTSHDQNRCYAIATPDEMQWAKRRALKMQPEKLEDTSRDEERGSAVIYWSSIRSAYTHARLLSMVDTIARKEGGTMGFRDNRIEFPEEEVQDDSEGPRELPGPGEKDYFHIARMGRKRSLEDIS